MCVRLVMSYNHPWIYACSLSKKDQTSYYDVTVYNYTYFNIKLEISVESES